MNMPKFIEFDEIMPHPEGIWLIRNKRSKDILGHIEWYAPWRQYVTSFSESSVWSQDCLADISEFIKATHRPPPVAAMRKG